MAILVSAWLACAALGQEAPTTAPASRPADEAKPAAAPKTARKEPAKSEPPAKLPPVRTPSQPSAEDILREFQKERPTNRPVLPSGDVGESTTRPEGVAGPAGAPRARLPDGYFLDSRVGRVSQNGPWWVFTFESENPGVAPEPPMRLVPNRLLEAMARQSEAASAGLTFIVSGEVTDFRGENYLLLRKLLRRRDMGNLSK